MNNQTKPYIRTSETKRKIPGMYPFNFKKCKIFWVSPKKQQDDQLAPDERTLKLISSQLFLLR